MNMRSFGYPLLLTLAFAGGCAGGGGRGNSIPFEPPATQGFAQGLSPAVTPVFTEYKPPANGVTGGIAFGHDNAVWFTQNNSYVGRFLNGSFSAVHVNIPMFNYFQQNAHPILTALSTGIYGGVEYDEQTGFNQEQDIYQITYTRHVSLTSGSQISSPNAGSMQGIAAGPSAAYATGSYDELGPPGCSSCLYLISNTGKDTVRTQNFEAGEAVAYLGGYVYVAAAENYGNGTQTGVRIYRVNATTFAGFTKVAALSAPSNIHGMTAGPDGALWFTDNGRNAIGRFISGTLHEYAVPTAAANPQGITRGLDGALWFTESHADKIGRITTAGVITEYHVPVVGGRPTWIAASGVTRTLWFSDIGTGKIGRVTY